MECSEKKIPIFTTDIATKIVSVPTDWGMFSMDGEKKVHDLATRFALDLAGSETTKEQYDALDSMMASRKKLGNTDGTDEIVDTYTREKLDKFMMDVAIEAGMNGFDVNERYNWKWNCNSPSIKKDYWWACKIE